MGPHVFLPRGSQCLKPRGRGEKGTPRPQTTFQLCCLPQPASPRASVFLIFLGVFVTHSEHTRQGQQHLLSIDTLPSLVAESPCCQPLPHDPPPYPHPRLLSLRSWSLWALGYAPAPQLGNRTPPALVLWGLKEGLGGGPRVQQLGESGSEPPIHFLLPES